jgi:hypothetical protein
MATLAAAHERFFSRPDVCVAYLDDGTVKPSVEGQKLTLNLVGKQIWTLASNPYCTNSAVDL